MNKLTKELLLEQRIITPQDKILKDLHNNELIPIIEGIQNSGFYPMMKKFSINAELTIKNRLKIYIPDDILRQYFGKNHNDEFTQDVLEKEFMFWYSFRGMETKMILIPTVTCDLLSKIDSAKKFRDYFEKKEYVGIKRLEDDIFVIRGIPSNFTHPGRQLNFLAENSFYIEIKRI